jgi:hypothetical protein
LGLLFWCSSFLYGPSSIDNPSTMTWSLWTISRSQMLLLPITALLIGRIKVILLYLRMRNVFWQVRRIFQILRYFPASLRMRHIDTDNFHCLDCIRGSLKNAPFFRLVMRYNVMHTSANESSPFSSKKTAYLNNVFQSDGSASIASLKYYFYMMLNRQHWITTMYIYFLCKWSLPDQVYNLT